MKQMIAGVLTLMILTACSDNCKKRSARYYIDNKPAFAVTQERNHFSIQLAYMPLIALPVDTAKSDAKSSFYHFRMQVKCPPGNAIGQGDKTPLFYGLDTVFAAGGINEGVLPVSVEPVITGGSGNYEYLVVFEKSDLKEGDKLEIVFKDRLFTNTKMSFVFDRKKIEALELLHC